jgi:hypothetical protein
MIVYSVTINALDSESGEKYGNDILKMRFEQGGEFVKFEATLSDGDIIEAKQGVLPGDTV